MVGGLLRGSVDVPRAQYRMAGLIQTLGRWNWAVKTTLLWGPAQFVPDFFDQRPLGISLPWAGLPARTPAPCQWQVNCNSLHFGYCSSRSSVPSQNIEIKKSWDDPVLYHYHLLKFKSCSISLTNPSRQKQCQCPPLASPLCHCFPVNLCERKGPWELAFNTTAVIFSEARRESCLGDVCSAVWQSCLVLCLNIF